ncbi:unnamed protein product, partial [Symbiodinium microadriaticum]
MGDEMTEAAAAEPGLTIGELVDKTTDKLTFMKGYMEGCARMVNMEAEEYLEQRDAEAGAAQVPRNRVLL